MTLNAITAFIETITDFIICERDGDAAQPKHKQTVYLHQTRFPLPPIPETHPLTCRTSQGALGDYQTCTDAVKEILGLK